MIRPIVGFGIFVALAASASAQDKSAPVPEKALRAAAERAIEPMQKSQGVWFENRTCFSCHHHFLPELTLALARQHDAKFKAAAAREFSTKTFSYLKDLDAIVQGYDYIDEIDDATRLVAAHAAGIKPDLATDAAARFIAYAQRGDGSWYTM